MRDQEIAWSSSAANSGGSDRAASTDVDGMTVMARASMACDGTVTGSSKMTLYSEGLSHLEVDPKNVAKVPISIIFKSLLFLTWPRFVTHVT